MNSFADSQNGMGSSTVSLTNVSCTVLDPIGKSHPPFLTTLSFGRTLRTNRKNSEYCPLQVNLAHTCLCCIFSGALTVGLVRQCQTIHGRDRTCIPPRLPPEWVTTLFFIIMGIISLTVTCGLLVASHWRREATKYARWIAFTGTKHVLKICKSIVWKNRRGQLHLGKDNPLIMEMILFCMAALIFPIGFYINEVGGQPYKLPNNTVVGSSYVLFVLSIFFTIVGLLFAGKVCLPG
ncbi:PREDICTED: uncharacterized protein C16orf52 homolog [Gavialis gangeticus]|uniref:uncharacterized protein C16orf52 homolog n=1 Tax=Gavialis gangeticus TaxID=94835 RepID=UPI00092EC961|nr:PREDICTED: uncharacterized protein C16orf52 homolog [Gavialis gangeticus]